MSKIGKVLRGISIKVGFKNLSQNCFNAIKSKQLLFINLYIFINIFFYNIHSS